ncbi:hypothetical protein ACIBG8_35320 [Nonomuraea sp. NPDC050556]|uniref:hypothetical protein n=1 Tax=Nonomuraea sp. NPDC050556 TaxID=3364369 RepID=UPI0037BE1EFC
MTRAPRDDQRLSPAAIASAASDLDPTLAVLLYTSWFALPAAVVGGLATGSPSWALAIGLGAGVLVAVLVDAQELLTLRAERAGHAETIPEAAFPREGDAHDEIRAGELRPGDWICRVSEHDKVARPVRERNAKRQRDHELRMLRAKDDAAHPEQPALDDEPEPQFLPLVTAVRSADGRTVTFHVVGRDEPIEPHLDDFFYRIARRRPLAEGGGGIADLLKALDEDWRPEADVPEAQAQDALRACLMTRLAEREERDRSFEAWTRLRRLLRAPVPPPRRIRLTTLGVAWRNADESPWQGGPVTQININNSSINHSVIGGTGDAVHNEIHLRPLLTEVLEYVDAHSDRLADSEDRKAVEKALKELREQASAAEPEPTKVKKALGVLTRFAGGLFVGVVGNGLYERIVALLG